MTERIGVTYYPVLGGGYHMALFYERGDGSKQVVEFGPTNRNPGVSPMSVEIAKELGSISDNSASPYGLLKGGNRDWVPSRDELLPRETIKEGTDLSGEWASILGTKDAVNAGDLSYLPLMQNSNTFVMTAVDRAGIARPTGVGTDFGGNIDAYWIPGAQNTIPLNGAQSSLIAPVDVVTSVAETDQQGSITHISLTMAYGAQITIGLDQQDQHDWATLTSVTDEYGLATSVTSIGDDGAGITGFFDPLDILPWAKRIAGTDADGLSKFNIEVEDDGSLGETRIDGAVVTAAQIGSILGSNLGHVLGGNSLAGQVAAGTLAGAIGRQIGISLGTGWLSTDLTWIDPVTGASGMSSATGLAIEGMDTRIEAGFGQALSGQLSSLLIGELAEALDLDGFEGGLFQSPGPIGSRRARARHGGDGRDQDRLAPHH